MAPEHHATSGGPGNAADPVEMVLAELRRRGGRVTSTRRLVLRALFEHSGHRTAPELAEDLAREVQAYGLDVHMSTIYRFLDELEELGVVTHSHLGHGDRLPSLRGSDLDRRRRLH